MTRFLQGVGDSMVATAGKLYLVIIIQLIQSSLLSFPMDEINMLVYVKLLLVLVSSQDPSSAKRYLTLWGILEKLEAMNTLFMCLQLFFHAH